MNNPFEKIDVNTAINARKNRHLHIPLRVPSLDKTENGPTCRNFVIPMDAAMIDIVYEAKNQIPPPKPPYTAHWSFSG